MAPSGGGAQSAPGCEPSLPGKQAALLRLARGETIALYAVPTDDLVHHDSFPHPKRPVDLVVGFVDGPEDRGGVRWAWGGTHLYPHIGAYLPGLAGAGKKYAVCCALDHRERHVFSLFNQKHGEATLRSLLDPRLESGATK